MNITCQSEYGTLQSVFIKKAADAFVDASTIRQQWQELNFLSEPDFQQAQNEYHHFEKFLRTTTIKKENFG